MTTPAIVTVAVLAVVLLAAIAFMVLARRSDVRGAGALSAETQRRDIGANQRAAADAAREVESAATERAQHGAVALAGASVPASGVDGTGLVPWVAPDRDEIDLSRREFFNRSIVGLMGIGLGTFAAASFVAYLWPTKTGGFGGKVQIGRLDDVKAGITSGSGFFYASEALSWVTEYPAEALPKAEEVYSEHYAASLLPGMKAGLIASWQKCPHLGCRVPQCVSSQWFECGCHGSQYNRVGEKKGGPAPRGMDHFPIEVTGAGQVIIDTGTVVPGLPIGINTTGQEAEGPHCVGATEH